MSLLLLLLFLLSSITESDSAYYDTLPQRGLSLHMVLVKEEVTVTLP